MLVEGQLIKVKVIGITLKHYRDLGYNVNLFDEILVPPNHLTNGSKCEVNVICDICGEEMHKPYKEYLKHHTNNLDTCNKCKNVKSVETCIKIYGVSNPMLLPEVKEKIKKTVQNKYGVDYASQSEIIKEKKKKTCMSNYGVEYPMLSSIIKNKQELTNIKKYGCKVPTQNDSVKKKIQETNIKKYGDKNPMKNILIQNKVKKTNIKKYSCECVFQNPYIQNKIKKTNIERYGVENPFACEDIKNKIRNTINEKYGVDYPTQNLEIRKKAIDSMFKNGTVPTSSQQVKLYEIIKTKYDNAILNYPFSNCFLDIFISVNNINIDIEYDGYYWHQDKKRDIKRDKFLQSQGFKVLRIKSSCLLPTEKELFNAIDYLVDTDHIFKEIILSDWKGDDEDELLSNSTAV